jgi:hypothetical protein
MRHGIHRDYGARFGRFVRALQNQFPYDSYQEKSGITILRYRVQDAI